MADRKQRYEEKRKQKKKESDFQKLKDELEKTKFENVWFDPNRNPYLNRLPSEENQKYHAEKRKRFDLQYDIDHFWEREKGDARNYKKQRDKDYSAFCLEQDIKDRIIRWKLFKEAIFKKVGRDPDFTDMMNNSVCKPEEICPDSEFYREDLLYLLENKTGDLKFNKKVITYLDYNDSSDEE